MIGDQGAGPEIRNSGLVTRSLDAGARIPHLEPPTLWSFWLLAAMLAWSIFAVGGVYRWAGVPLIASAIVLSALARPPIAASSETRVLDRALLGCVAVAALQCVPLPRTARALLFSHRETLESELVVGPTALWEPLSLDPWASVYAISLIVTAMLVFWTCRYACARGSAHRLSVAVALIGFVAALTALAQHAGDPTKIYGLFQPIDEGARPFGPFVNRNHFATWAVMAIPLAAGYVVMSFARRTTSSRVADEIASLMQSVGTRTVWVAVAAAVMVLALVASTSRSGLMAAAVSLGTVAVLGRGRSNRRTWIWLAVGLVLLVGFLVAYSSLDPLLSRAEETLERGSGERTRIWIDTLALISDAWLTGTGLGSYQTAMLLYRHTSPVILVNQAHNQYLQILAEGGLLLFIPAAVSLVAFARLFVVRLKRDTSPTAWLRIGGAAAVMAVGVQSVWETGLRMPANGILFAVAAAIAVHRPGNSR